jgi:RHS repeat-associated protein
MKPPLRTKSVGTKVSEAEFALLEERARGAGLRLAEWVRTLYDGSVGASYQSLPWGDGYTATVNNSYAGLDNLDFAGLERDVQSTTNPEEDTEHAQFRNYAPAQGRWLSPDRYLGSYDLTNPQSFNRYAYVLNNPTSFTDPSGLDPTCIIDPDTGNLECISYYPTDPPPSGCVSNGTQGCIPSSCATPFGCDGAPPPGSSGSGTQNNGPLHTANLSNAPSNGTKARVQCAAANASSFANLLGISNSNWLGQTLLGNDISTISNLVFGPEQASSLYQAAVSNPTPANAIVQGAKAIGSTQSTQLQLVETAAQDAFGNSQYYARALSLAETTGGKALSEAFSGFGLAKLAFDGGAYAYAYAKCGN